MTYELCKTIHEVAQKKLGHLLPKPAENAPVWSNGSLYLRLQLDCEHEDIPEDERITDYVPDYSNASNSLALLRAVADGKNLKISQTDDAALLALVCEAFGLERRRQEKRK